MAYCGSGDRAGSGVDMGGSGGDMGGGDDEFEVVLMGDEGGDDSGDDGG